MAESAKQLRIPGTAPKARALNGASWMDSVAAQATGFVNLVLVELAYCTLAEEAAVQALGVALRYRLENVTLAAWVASDRAAVLEYVEQARIVLGPRWFNVAHEADALVARLEVRR